MSSSRSRRTASPATRRSPGFTLLELLAVVLVIGLALSVVLPNLDRLTPKYRLRAAAREVASTMELARHLAITRVGVHSLRYEIDPPGFSSRSFYEVLLPEDEAGDREGVLRRSFPDGVILRSVILAGDDRVGSGTAVVDFSPTGETGAHVVVLENEVGSVLSVKFQPLVGLGSFHEGEVGFESYLGGP